MKVSLNTVKQLIDFELPPTDELVARVNAQLGKAEKVINLADKYKDALIVRVVECKKHENADKLSVTKIDDGGVVNDVPRDENGLVQVVCGAPNVHADMWAVWLPPGATVPASYDDAEPFVLSARELRGVLSQGMLAAADELAIGTAHDGIIEINADEWRPYTTEIKPGAKFAAAYGLDDTILDIENKMFTHRPDCFGQLGVAREIAGILGHKFTSPDWYLTMPQFEDGEGLNLEVFNDTPEKVPRAMFVAMKNVEIKPSPLWLQCALVAMGSKPINNIVDVTNYVMLLTAQPTHAYDYDKLRGQKIGARMARDGEVITLLNGKTYELTPDDIVIADGEGAIGLAGIMGGGNSEVSVETKNIVLEVATFDMYTLRKSSMRHGVFTDALARFNKGQSPLQNDRIINLLMMRIKDVSLAEQASGVFDRPIASRETQQPVLVTPSFIMERLGRRLDNEYIRALLESVEFIIDEHEFNKTESYESDLDGIVERKESKVKEKAMYVQTPFWRTDIELPEDIIEEVGRLYGFDKLPRELPLRSMQPAAKNELRDVKQKLRQSLEKFGANEVLTYSFVHENVMKRAEQDVSQAFQLSNALSPDLQYYRLSVLPSLLDKVHMNIKAGHDEFVLYEIGKAHNKKYHADDDEGLPAEMEMLDAVYASKKAGEGAPFYYMRRLVQALALDYGFTLRFKPVTESLDYPLTAPFDLSRSALLETYDGTFIGMIGELKQSVLKNFKLPGYTAAMSLDIEGLVSAINTFRQRYTPLSKYPSITQDVSLMVPDNVPYETVSMRVIGCLNEQSEKLDIKVSPVSIYRSKEATGEKTITVRIRFTSHGRTLSDDDVAPIMTTVGNLKFKANT